MSVLQKFIKRRKKHLSLYLATFIQLEKGTPSRHDRQGLKESKPI